MSFPQPASTLAVTSYQQFFRLNTPLASPGDIYEIEVPVSALVIGPNSDIANIAVNYFDDTNPPSMIAGFTLTPQQPWLTGIAARMDVPYPQVSSGTNQRLGRILVSAIDIYDPNARPPDFVAGTDVIDFIVPVIDVIGYFSAAPSTAGKRADRVYNYEFYNTTGSKQQWIMVPFYGRNYAMIDIKNQDAAVAVDVIVYAANFTVTNDGKKHIWTLLQGTTNLPAVGGSTRLLIEAGEIALNQGRFDALCIGIKGHDGPCPMRIVTSDNTI